MNFAVHTKLECIWRCRLVPARAARCATCLWTFGSVNLPQAFYLRRTTQIHKRTWTCITPRIRFNQMYFVGQQYKTNGLGFMNVSRALCIFTLSGRLWAQVIGDGEICSGRLATDPTYVKYSE